MSSIFTVCADAIHVFSIFLLLWKLRKSKSCVGVSCRMQELYAIVFCFRYLNLFYTFFSVYNTVLKVLFLSSTFYLVYLMRYQPPVSATYDRASDCFPYEKYLLPPCAILALLTSATYQPAEILWTASIWLESVAIVPQLTLLQSLREVENLTSDYVFSMGLYRGFYVCSWVYRYISHGKIYWVSCAGGIIQTLLYFDFFYYYVMSKWYGQKLVLPLSA